MTAIVNSHLVNRCCTGLTSRLGVFCACSQANAGQTPCRSHGLTDKLLNYSLVLRARRGPYPYYQVSAGSDTPEYPRERYSDATIASELL